MKRKLFFLTLAFIAVITMITGLFYFKVSDYSYENRIRKQVVALNEIKNLSELIHENERSAAVNDLEKALEQYENTLLESTQKDDKAQTKELIIFIYITCVLFILMVFGYIYLAILKPFDKMKAFADEIAKGNFDIPLNYERSNYFGAFTWAFDHMRKEILKARACEKEAILNNKTVIATISHDIKTPIASIRAYSEGLQANLDSDTEKRTHYISVIMKKCDEVTNLTNDLFLHSLSDLDKLKINIEPVNVKDRIEKAVENISDDVNTIHILNFVSDCIVMLDKQRFEQVLENLINNSQKYAGTKIDISCETDENQYIIKIRDYGSGIPDEDMPYVFGKFYRGRNVGDKQGSGLGLYIVKYIMCQHDGDIKLYNHSDGLEAVLSLPKIK